MNLFVRNKFAKVATCWNACGASTWQRPYFAGGPVVHNLERLRVLEGRAVGKVGVACPRFSKSMNLPLWEPGSWKGTQRMEWGAIQGVTAGF